MVLRAEVWIVWDSYGRGRLVPDLYPIAAGTKLVLFVDDTAFLALHIVKGQWFRAQSAGLTWIREIVTGFIPHLFDCFRYEISFVR